MRLGAVVAFASLLCLPAVLAEEPVVLDGCRTAMFDDLLRMSSHSGTEGEAAAFIIEDEGQIRCQMWPAATGARSSTWKGAVPRGTIAIAHTHPDIAHLRMPSGIDVDLAQHVGLPLYTITHAEVWKVDTHGNRTRTKRTERDRSCGCRQPRSVLTARAGLGDTVGVIQTAP